MQTQTQGAALELGTSSVGRVFHFWAYLGSFLLKSVLSAPEMQHLHCYKTHRNKIQLKDQRTTNWRKMILWKSEHFPFGVPFHLFLFLFMYMCLCEPMPRVSGYWSKPEKGVRSHGPGVSAGDKLGSSGSIQLS